MGKEGGSNLKNYLSDRVDGSVFTKRMPNRSKVGVCAHRARIGKFVNTNSGLNTKMRPFCVACVLCMREMLVNHNSMYVVHEQAH